MKQKIKDFIQRQNEKGRLLWVRPKWYYVHDLFSFKRLYNLLYYVYLIRVRSYRRLQLGKNIKNGVFYLCVEGEGDEAYVVKIPHLRTRISWWLYTRLKNIEAFREYYNTLISISGDPILGEHFPSVKQVRRDGGYRSSYVRGYNLTQMRDMVYDGRPLPPDVKPSEVIFAIEQLLARLTDFMNQNGTLSGDWALHNLIYDKASKRIINVDVEGLYTYQHPRLEANIEYIEVVLNHLKAILQMWEKQEPLDISILKVISMVAYATEANVSYSGRAYPSGYHSMNLRGKYFRGQRECLRRLSDVPYNFDNKIVLDLGCNCGGMLHCLANKILMGVGMDSERRCINAANLIKFLNVTQNLHFYTLDLEREPLTVIDKFFLGRHVDICFLLSVCMWLTNWKDVICYAAKTSDTLLFEANGNDEQQREQVAFLQVCFRKVQLINSESRDDMNVKMRALFMCQDHHARA